MPFNVYYGITRITDERVLRLPANTTSERPIYPYPGQLFFDTTLNKLIVWDGGNWRESAISTLNTVPLWSWGAANNGQLGNNQAVTGRSSPGSVVGGIADWTQVSTGAGGWVSSLRANGGILNWGAASLGQNGTGAGGARSSPTSIAGATTTGWFQVAAGYNHGVALRFTTTSLYSQVWSWGGNNFGQHGTGSLSASTSSPTITNSFGDTIQVSAGYMTSGFLRSGLDGGILMTCGVNFYGQLGDGTTNSRSAPTTVVGGFTNWTQVSMGHNFSAGVRANGTAWCWGINAYGQLGNNTTTNASSPVSVVGGFTDWVQIATGGNRTIFSGLIPQFTGAIRGNGTAWCWGRNNNGQLGNNATTNVSSPVSVVGGFTDWVQISCGDSTTMAVRANGTAWGWGSNANGEIGDNTTTARSSPVSVVGGFTDWVQISTGRALTIGVRGQPRSTTIRQNNLRNTFE